MKFLKEHEEFNNFVTDEIPRFSTYILSNGKFVDLADGTHGHFELYCDDEGIEYASYLKNAIQCNDGKNTFEDLPNAYIDLPKVITDAQYKSLLKWLDKLNTMDEVEVVANGQSKLYKLSDYIPEEIIKRIKRYYSSGTLYENNN